MKKKTGVMITGATMAPVIILRVWVSLMIRTPVDVVDGSSDNEDIHLPSFCLLCCLSQGDWDGRRWIHHHRTWDEDSFFSWSLTVCVGTENSGRTIVRTNFCVSELFREIKTEEPCLIKIISYDVFSSVRGNNNSIVHWFGCVVTLVEQFRGE